MKCLAENDYGFDFKYAVFLRFLILTRMGDPQLRSLWESVGQAALVYRLAKFATPVVHRTLKLSGLLKSLFSSEHEFKNIYSSKILLKTTLYQLISILYDV